MDVTSHVRCNCIKCTKLKGQTWHHVVPSRFSNGKKGGRVFRSPGLQICRSCHDSLEILIPFRPKLRLDEYLTILGGFLFWENGNHHRKLRTLAQVQADLTKYGHMPITPRRARWYENGEVANYCLSCGRRRMIYRFHVFPESFFADELSPYVGLCHDCCVELEKMIPAVKMPGKKPYIYLAHYFLYRRAGDQALKALLSRIGPIIKAESRINWNKHFPDGEIFQHLRSSSE